MTDRPNYTTVQLAKRWECTDQTIRNMVKRGELYCFKIGTLTRIPAWEVQRIEGSSYTVEHGALSGVKVMPPREHPYVPKTGGKQNETTRNI